jgi:hypothetical protein
MVFGLPNLSDVYREELAKKSIPFILPILQTFLTISVYATVGIAINGYLFVRTTTDQDGGWVQNVTFWLNDHGINGTALSIGLIVIFSSIFNISRWFEIESKDVMIIEESEYKDGDEDQKTNGTLRTILKVIFLKIYFLSRPARAKAFFK